MLTLNIKSFEDFKSKKDKVTLALANSLKTYIETLEDVCFTKEYGWESITVTLYDEVFRVLVGRVSEKSMNEKIVKALQNQAKTENVMISSFTVEEVEISENSIEYKVIFNIVK